MTFLQNLLDIMLEAAPWLVLGLALGGLMKALIPSDFLHRHLGGQGFGSVIKAAVIGAPMPLCSCGVIPAALGLRKAGASKPATTSFLVSTPETGVDSILITYALLGPFMAIARPIAALASAFTAGALVAGFDREEASAGKTPLQSDDKSTDCCSHSAKSSCCDTTHTAIETPTKPSSCCGTAEAKATDAGWMAKGWQGIRYAFTQLLDDIALWLLLGLVFAALVKTFLPADFLAQWGSGLIAMLVMMLAGIPMYICATASTPVAAGLMLAGVSPGVALVLLLTGPATNISTLGVIRQELGTRSLWLYLLGVCFTALAAGLLTNWLVMTWQIQIDISEHGMHEGLFGGLQWMALLLLVGVMFGRFFNRK